MELYQDDDGPESWPILPQALEFSSDQGANQGLVLVQEVHLGDPDQ